VVIGSESFGEAVPFHHHEGQAIRQAPVLIAAAPVQIYCTTMELGLERDNLDRLSP